MEQILKVSEGTGKNEIQESKRPIHDAPQQQRKRGRAIAWPDGDLMDEFEEGK